MPRSLHPLKRASVIARAFCQDRTGANAVEFGLVALPFLLLTIFVLQLGVYFMSKSAVDTGVLIVSENIRAQFNTGFAPIVDSGCTLTADVAKAAGSLIPSNYSSVLFVELQPLSNLNTSVVPINTSACATNTNSNPGTSGTVLVLRALYYPPSFMPNLTTTPTVYSSAIIRRQSQ